MLRRSRSVLAGVVLVAALAAGSCGQREEPPAPAGQPGLAGPGFEAVVAEVEPSVVTVLVEQGIGSGVVFREGGLVLTNEHVVGAQPAVGLALADGARVPAEVLATDPVTDLAVLRAQRPDLPPAEFRTGLPAPGQLVLALGSPLGLRNSATLGIVSGVGREIPGSAGQAPALVDLIQTDAAISPGSSGGALVDPEGRVVGINDAYIPPQAGAVSLGFAIPSGTAVEVADDLLDDGEVTHPYLGVAAGRLTPQIADRLGAPSPLGVLIRAVDPAGPAAAAGLRPGDIVTGFGEEEIETVEGFLGALRGVEPGQPVPVRYTRGGQAAEVTVTVDAVEG
jgi:S1-C subfamily serine protease